tara:strand:- start:220 stop:327 length:108 start_codon:yes stop_codon:yes gene_type:complete
MTFNLKQFYYDDKYERNAVNAFLPKLNQNFYYTPI